MSDFLDQFTNKNYKKEKDDVPVPPPEPPVEPEEPASSAAEPVIIPEKETAWTDSSIPRTDTTKQESLQKFSGVKAIQHDIVIDTTYNRNKTIRIISVCAAVVLLCAGAFFAYLYLSKVPMLDFQGKNISDARTWALKNQIELDEQFEFSDSVESDIILTQDIAPGDKVSQKTSIILTISKGPDPDEKVEVPDFPSLTIPEIQEWIDENKLLNTQFQEENSSTVEKGGFIREEYRDVSVDKDHFTRTDYLTIFVSIGLEGMTETVRVPNFINMTKTAADSFAQNNNVTLSYSLKLSETIAADVILSQENPAGSQVPVGSTIRLALSAGSGIMVPDYSKFMKEDAPAAESALTLSVKVQYSFTTPYGKLISQSVPAGEHVFTTQNQLTVVYSEGKPYIDNLIGTSEKDIPAYFYAFKQKGLAIPYSITYVDSSVEKGKVVTVSRFNEFLSSSETIAIGISRGNLPTPTP